jgi:hypothetical protein
MWFAVTARMLVVAVATALDSRDCTRLEGMVLTVEPMINRGTSS